MAETTHNYLGADNKLSIQRHSAVYCPTGGQSLVKLIYSGINPADLVHGTVLGFNDNIAGYEGSGVVTAAGPDSPFNHTEPRIVEQAHMSWKIPPHVPLADAAAMTIMVRTATDALFNLLEVPFPPLSFHCGEDSAPGASGPILIWGGASTVGFAAIQLAKAAGLKPIIVTASPHNHEQLRKYGADYCIDYSYKDVVERVRAIVEAHGRALRCVFDTVGIRREGYSSPALCEACATSSSSDGARFVCCVPVVGNPRWRMVLATREHPIPTPGPDNTTVLYEAHPDWDRRLMQTVLWAANELGKRFFMPPIEVVKGAEAGVRAIEQSAAGKVSFKKIIIEHPL